MLVSQWEEISIMSWTLFYRALADMNNDGKMDMHEFSIAMKLIKLKLQGHPLPPSLPPSMKQQPLSIPPQPPFGKHPCIIKSWLSISKYINLLFMIVHLHKIYLHAFWHLQLFLIITCWDWVVISFCHCSLQGCPVWVPCLAYQQCHPCPFPPYPQGCQGWACLPLWYHQWPHRYHL